MRRDRGAPTGRNTTPRRCAGFLPVLLILASVWLGGAATAAMAQPGSGGPDPGGSLPIRLRLPFSGSYPVTQPFGCTMNPLEFAYGTCPHFHRGIDYGLPLNTPVLAAAAGQVSAAGPDPRGARFRGGYGNRVVIDHGRGITTLYGHLGRVDVAVGDVVAAGQQIGLSGSSGNSTAPHLHFEVDRGPAPIDPAPGFGPGFTGDPASGASASAETSGAATTAGASGSGQTACGWDNPGGCLTGAIADLIGGFFSLVGAMIGRWISGALEPLAVMNIWTNTPALLTYACAPVRAMWDAARVIADALLGLWLALMALQRARDAAVGKPVEPLGAVLSHVLLVALAANTSLLLIGWFIEVSNAITGSIGLLDGGNVASILIAVVLGALQYVGVSTLLASTGPIGWLIIVALPLAKLVLIVLLGLQMLRRLGLLIGCIVTAPVGIMAHAWEATRHWGQRWSDHFWPVLITQTIQVMVLHVGFSLTLDFGDVVNAFARNAMSGAGLSPHQSAWLALLNPAAVGAGAVAALALYIMQSLLGLSIMVTALKVPHLLHVNLGRIVGLGTVTAASLARTLWGNPVAQPWALGAAAATVGTQAAGAMAMGGTLLFGAAPRPVFAGDSVGRAAGGGGRAGVRSSPGDHGRTSPGPGGAAAGPRGAGGVGGTPASAAAAPPPSPGDGVGARAAPPAPALPPPPPPLVAIGTGGGPATGDDTDTPGVA